MWRNLGGVQRTNIHNKGHIIKLHVTETSTQSGNNIFFVIVSDAVFVLFPSPSFDFVSFLIFSTVLIFLQLLVQFNVCKRQKKKLIFEISKGI